MKSALNILQPEAQALNTAVLVLDETNTLAFAATVDPMRAANRLAGRPIFDWDYVSATDEVPMLSSGLTVPCFPLAQLETCDALIVLAGFQLARHATPSLLSGLRRISDSGATLIGIDGGSWLMAEAGLLDGLPATTHWNARESFARRFPQVSLSDDPFTVAEGCITAGGGTAAVDLMLHVINARMGAGFAGRMADLFAPPLASPQDGSDQDAIVTLPSGGERDTALTDQAHTLMEDTLATPMPLSMMAEILGTSTRTLQQQFRLRLNTTPQDHYLQLRLAEARRLVTDTSLPLMEVAEATGFTSQSSFSRAFRTAHGVSARDLRQEEFRQDQGAVSGRNSGTEQQPSGRGLLPHSLARFASRSSATRH